MQKKYHIRDLEEITGIKAHTIRMWEKRYNIINPDRSDTNIRYYDEASFKKFLLISQLYHNNIKISDISRLNIEQLKEKALLLNRSTEEYEAWDLELFESIINFDAKRFDNTIRDALFILDLNKLIVFLLFPFLHKIDVFWKSNTITELNKEFAFQTAKQFLFSVTNAISKYSLKNGRKIILFSDNNEMNIFPLLYAEIIINKLNFESISFKNINSLEYFFQNIENLPSKRVVTVAPMNKQKLDIIVDFIRQNKSYTFFIIDTNYLLNIEEKNAILINTLEDLEDEITFSLMG